MPTWGELLQELAILQEQSRKEIERRGGPPPPGTPSPHDVLRRKYLAALSRETGRATIVYATAFQELKEGVSGPDLSIGGIDMQGFMEACSNIEEGELDLLLHSPGGSPEAAEALMSYLRTRFKHIRVIVPIAAMSAATMMALAADQIVMGAHSQLGPIDPQLSIQTPEGARSAPAQAIINQFEMAKEECRDPSNIAAWLPILRSYAPGLLALCVHQRKLAEDFATRSLTAFMFSGRKDAQAKAKRAAEWFADFEAFQSHGRRVGRDDARALDLDIIDLEEDDNLQDLTLSVHHAVAHTLSGTPAFKVIENHHGRAFIQQKQVQIVGFGPQPSGTEPRVPGPTGDQSMNRAARRRAKRGR